MSALNFFGFNINFFINFVEILRCSKYYDLDDMANYKFDLSSYVKLLGLVKKNHKKYLKHLDAQNFLQYFEKYRRI